MTAPKLTALLLTTSLALLAASFAPAASAHDCTAEDPEKSCGECREGSHRHWYNDYKVYCASTPSPAEACNAASDLVRELFTCSFVVDLP